MYPKPRQKLFPRQKRLGRSRAVTIGIGFLCDAGIILGADNQITWPTNHKYYECKIYRFSFDRCPVAFTFAGNPNLMKMFHGKFEAAMKLVPPPYTASIIHFSVPFRYVPI